MAIIRMNTVLMGILNQKKQGYWVSELPIFKITESEIKSTFNIEKLSVVSVMERTSLSEPVAKITGFNVGNISVKSIKNTVSNTEYVSKVTGFSIDKLSVKSVKVTGSLDEPSKVKIVNNLEKVSLWGQFNKGYNNSEEDKVGVLGTLTSISLKNR